jgi:hypothetical protein
MERRRGNRLQYPDHSNCDSVVLNETVLIVKDLPVVAVKADDEPRG